MKRTLIQKHSTTIVKNLAELVRSISDLSHNPTKGELRELFVSNVLSFFLTQQFSVGNGVVVNSKGTESNQTDIIIYDNRILPPFVNQQNIGVYPAESVIATIEVKSQFKASDIKESEKRAENLYSCYRNKEEKPLCGVLGLTGKPLKLMLKHIKGKEWIDKNIKCIFAICHIDHYCWMNVTPKGWRIALHDDNYEEVKRFIAVLIDNIRRKSAKRMEYLNKHRDWLSNYIRDKNTLYP